jgi:NAD-specific glutamate dehydrogenase
LHRTLCLQVLSGSKKSSAESIAAWQKANAVNVQHAFDSLKEMRTLPHADFATLSVATQAIRRLV